MTNSRFLFFQGVNFIELSVKTELTIIHVNTVKPTMYITCAYHLFSGHSTEFLDITSTKWSTFVKQSLTRLFLDGGCFTPKSSQSQNSLKFPNFILWHVYGREVPLRQRDRVVSASDSQSDGPGFESRSGHLLDLCSVVPSSISRPCL